MLTLIEKSVDMDDDAYLIIEHESVQMFDLLISADEIVQFGSYAGKSWQNSVNSMNTFGVNWVEPTTNRWKGASSPCRVKASRSFICNHETSRNPIVSCT